MAVSQNPCSLTRRLTSQGLVPGDPEHLSTPTRTAPSPLVRNMSSMPDVGPSRVNVRVQFSTAWALGNIACRGERYIEKILEAAKKMLHTHGTPLSILSCEYTAAGMDGVCLYVCFIDGVRTRGCDGEV